jgi:hypothetical protein
MLKFGIDGGLRIMKRMVISVYGFKGISKQC